MNTFRAMERKKHFSRANQDRERSRQLMEKYARAKQLKATPYPSGFSVYRMRFIAPYAMLIYAFTILFLFGWLITKGNARFSTINITPSSLDFSSITIPDDNTIYKFIAHQNLKKGTTLKRSSFYSSNQSIYSELEIEILDENYNHMYTVYKNLWVEYYSGVEYSDTKLEFEIEIEKAGQYFLKVVSHNKNNGPIRFESYKTHGSMYFFNYLIFFIILNVILFFGNSYWGTTTMLFNALKKVKSIKNNSKFLIISSLVIILYLGCIVISFTHYGYPSTGDEIRLPTYFFDTKDVLYLG